MRRFGVLLLSAMFCDTAMAAPSATIEPVSGPLAQTLGDKPPAISVGGNSADEIKAKIKSGAIKRIPFSAAVPSNVEAQMDVEYGKAGEKPLLLDLFKPKGLTKPVPGILFVHGGGWSRYTRKMYQGYCVRFAKNGYVAGTVEYRLSGEAPFPAAIQDVKCAIRWLRANAAKVGVDPDKIGLVGGSAGGHLVLLAAYATGDSELEGTSGNEGVSSRVQAVVDLYGPVELKAKQPRGSVYTFMGKKMSDEIPDLYKKASPINHLTKDDPPTLILHGTVDELVPIEQSDRLAAKLGELGIPYLYDRQEGWHHAMDQVQEVNDRCVWFMDKFFARFLPLPK